jgi:hypothetical protein
MSWGATGEPGLWDDHVPTANDRESGTRNKKRKATGKGPGRTRPKPETANEREGRVPGSKKPYVYPGFDPSSTVPFQGGKGPSGKGKKKKKKKKKEEDGAAPAKVLPAVVTSSAVGGQVNPNVFDAYIAEIRRLTLRLVNNAKNLLLAYDFESINSATDYTLDIDNAAKTYNTIVTRALPTSPNFSLSQLTAQELTNQLINDIAEKISDAVPDSTRYDYFGSFVNGEWDPGSPSFLANQAKYDLKINVAVNPIIRNAQISLYEI